MAITKKGKYWYVYFRIKGRIIMRSLHTTSETEAKIRDAMYKERLRRKRDTETSNAILGLDGECAPPPQPLLEEEIAPSSRRVRLDTLFELALRHRPTLSDQHRREWARFCKNIRPRARYADELTPRICLDYLEKAVGQAKSKRYNNLRGQLAIIIRSSMVESGLSTNPFDAVIQRRGGDTTHYRPFTPAEQNAILSACSPYWRILSIISRDTGLRLTDCRRLAPCHIKGDIITLTPGKTARFGRAVKIPLLKSLKKELAAIAPLLPSPETPYCSAFHPSNTYKSTRSGSYYGGLCPSLNITPNQDGAVGFHSWRVTFVTRCRSAGIPDEVIRGMVGHTSDDMADLYSHDTAAAIKSMKKLEKHTQ